MLLHSQKALLETFPIYRTDVTCLKSISLAVQDGRLRVLSPTRAYLLYYTPPVLNLAAPVMIYLTKLLDACAHVRRAHRADILHRAAPSLAT